MSTIKKTITIPCVKTKTEYSYQTTLFDCYCHEFNEVVNQISKAIGCSFVKASQLARTAEMFGCVVVFRGSENECEKVADVLGSIGLDVRVSND